MPSQSAVRLAQLIPFSINLVRRVQCTIKAELLYSPERVLSRMEDPLKDPHNQPLRIDLIAEDMCAAAFNAQFRGKIVPLGEESLAIQAALHDLTEHKLIVALMDIIDGTDLFVRRLENWCSAIVFLSPKDQLILASVVGDHEGNIFYATHEEECAYYVPFRNPSVRVALTAGTRPENREDACARFMKGQVAGPSKIDLIDDASVCFYGQKPADFRSLMSGGFALEMDRLQAKLAAKTRPAPGFRIYNLGGIPMMLKVAVGLVDSVLGVKKSKPHDMVAGAYIALKSGATLGGIDGTLLDEQALAKMMLRPNERCEPYILAATDELFNGLRACFLPGATPTLGIGHHPVDLAGAELKLKPDHSASAVGVLR